MCENSKARTERGFYLTVGYVINNKENICGKVVNKMIAGEFFFSILI